MSHRNNDNNVPWNNRNPRNGGGDGNYKGGGNWAGNNRYGPDNRYNNNNKDRRNNYRGGGGYGGGGRRNYDDRRPYRNNSWNNNNGAPDGNYPRYQNNWLQKGHPDKGGNKYGMQQLPEPVDMMQQQIPPLMIDFGESVPEEPEQSQGKKGPSGSGDADGRKSRNGTPDSAARSERSMNESNGNMPWQQDGFGSPGEGFQGFAEDDFAKTSNGNSKVDAKSSTAREDKGDVSLPENELRTLIVDEALKIISDAEQPSCSSATQRDSSEAAPTATAPSASSSTANTTTNPERRASIERSAEQVTRKLINQLTSMNKHSLKQVINNPDSKYETALKTHARQKLRAEVRRQLRNFNLNDSTAQTKTSCGMLEPDECVDSDKIPEALLEQIGKVLDLNLLDLNVTEESVRDATPAGEVEDSVISSNEADYSATEVLDKNLRLTDEDEQLDTVDLFERAELLLMKGSESVRQGSSSGPSSPTDEMFPNEQIDSIVSEDNGEDMGDLDGDPDQEQIEKMLDERLAPNFPCFLRVSTVEELNKKVDDLPVPIDSSADDTVPIVLPTVESENSSSNPEIPSEVVDTPSVAVERPEPPQIPPVEISLANVADQPDSIENPLQPTNEEVVEPSLPPKEEVVELSLSPKENDVGQPPESVTESTELVIETPPIADTPVEEPPTQAEIPPTISSPEKASPPEQQPSSGIIRAPTHPELAARKPKGSKTYKPNLVQHEHSKRSDSAKSSTSSPSRPSSSSSSNATSSSLNSKATTKSGSSSNLTTSSKQNQKPQNNNNSNTTDKNESTGSSNRGRSRSRRDNATAQSLKDNSSHAASSSDPSHPSATPPSAPPSTSAGSSPAPQQQQQQQSVQQQPPPTRSGRAKTPGPSLAGGPQDHSSPLGVKKKKKKRNKRKDRSPPPDLAMELECDLRISRPAVTPTPPPVQQRDSTPVKKSAEAERSANSNSSSSTSSKPSRETRAKSADPKLYYESKKERNKDKQRSRDDDGRKSRTRDDRTKDHDRNRDKVDNRDRETRKEKEQEKDPGDGLTKVEVIEVGKPSDRSERKESPVPKSSGKSERLSNKEEPKDTTKEAAAVEKDKETLKESVKDGRDLRAKDILKEKETLSKDKEDKDVPDEKEPKGSDETMAVKGAAENPTEQTKPPKSEKKKKKKSLLKGPNLVKGRREVIEEPEPVIADEQKAENDEVVVVIEDTPPPSVSQLSDPETSSQTKNKQNDVAINSKFTTAPAEHPTVIATSTASIIHRTASPRPWKSPGEKKLIPPAISSMITHHPMSPPDRSRSIPTPTPPSPVMSPEPPHHHHHQHHHHQQRIHLAASPVVMPQPDVLTRMPLQSSITPLVATTVAPPVNEPDARD
ncbi:hypothetical protein RP20_CCG011505 [Aedes albopictus]|nr:hypothetical protein RP20_CCG011505 [Aedes albopictus]